MATDLKSPISELPIASPGSSSGTKNPRSGWLAVGAIAAGSAVLGGLAAAWYYRKALSQLREAENEIPDPMLVTTANGMGEDF